MMPSAISQPPPLHAAEFAWLTTGEASHWLEEIAQTELPIHTLAEKLRRELSASRSHLLLEQAELRHRGAAKFTRASQMLFTSQALEQATDEWIARYKAQRFRNRAHVADLCCGIGGDSIRLASVGRMTGVDRCLTATCCAAHNASVYRAGDAPPETFETAEVESIDVADYDAWHLDPDRRPQGRRTTRVELHEPSLDAIERMLLQQPNAAVKLAPAANLLHDPAWAAETEFEWISRGGECRQLVAWRGDLAQEPGFRRATRVILDESATFVGPPDEQIPTARRVGQFVFEPDSSVLAARLTGALASEYGLKAVTAGVAYLTGERSIADPFLSAFEIVDSLPLDRRKVAAYLGTRGIGRVEIKHRGLTLDPDQLRKELKLRGNKEATLLITKIAESATVLIANRISQRGSDEVACESYARTTTEIDHLPQTTP